MHVVTVLALEGVISFDLAAPCQVFGAVRLPDGTSPYEVRVCTPRLGVISTTCGAETFEVRSRWSLAESAAADTVIVSGTDNHAAPIPQDVQLLLRKAADRGARVASICTGAFALAAAGLLDGRRATTHWRFAAQLAELYPRVQVDSRVLFVEDDNVFTSAGIAAGLDLCLHMVRRDHGAAVAADTARMIVMPPQRDGGQAQFIVHDQIGPREAGIAGTMQWMQENLHRPLTLAEVAGHAAMSTRSLSRKFREQTGTTPLQWLLRQRVSRAQQLLETTDLPIERVATLAGFGSAVSMRQHFVRHLLAPPQAYRRAFRG